MEGLTPILPAVPTNPPPDLNEMRADNRPPTPCTPPIENLTLNQRRDEDMESQNAESPPRGTTGVQTGAMVIDEQAQRELPDELTQLYSLFSYIGSTGLKEASKNWGIGTDSTKVKMMDRCMLHVKVQKRLGKNMLEILSSNNSITPLNEFIDIAKENDRLWIPAPSEDALLSVLYPRIRLRWKKKLEETMNPAGPVGASNEFIASGSNSNTPFSPSTTEFSLNEFARLMVLLRDDERSKNAAEAATGGVLSRIHLECSTRKEDIWKIVAQRFNDLTVDSRESFTGSFDSVDSNARPLVDRTAACLRDQYLKGKSEWQRPRDFWERSGNNDPNSFPGMLTYTTSGDFTAGSTRSYIVFWFLD